MRDTIQDKIAEIIIESADQHGLNAYKAAERILALPEIMRARDNFKTAEAERSPSLKVPL